MTSHGNGYGDVAIRDAINQGRMEGPRYQVSTLGIVWGAAPANPSTPINPLAPLVIRSAEEGRAAVREEIGHGADWIKLYPAGAYSFSPTGKDLYEVTYPLPVLQAIIDETFRCCRLNVEEGGLETVIEQLGGLAYENILAVKPRRQENTSKGFLVAYLARLYISRLFT